MRVLLDTNIVIHREASKVVHPEIGNLFHWLDTLHYAKCLHPLTVSEIQRHSDQTVVKSFAIKLNNYTTLKTLAPLHEDVERTCVTIDTNANDRNDTLLLNEVFSDRVDILISEDRKLHRKAELLGIEDRVFKIDSFLEKVTAENPSLVDYKVLSARQELFGNINLKDPFFDNFRIDYKGFDKWFNKKADETAYICYHNEVLSAFLFIKIEDKNENYSDITPPLLPKKRLKIGTFKVTSNGFKLGERFLKIIFDNARQYKVEEIYVTIFDKRPEQTRLINLLEEWGFVLHGTKTGSSGTENVYVRDFSKHFDQLHPKHTYPWLSKTSNVYIVPIYPEYHTELFPDSILNTESKSSFFDAEPHRNSLSKVYVSHGRERNLNAGDIIIFYRTGGLYEGVATTIGIVESVKNSIRDENELVQLCRKRTVLSNEQLITFWNRYLGTKPFIVNFLYAFSFRKRPNLKQLIEMEIIPSIKDMPRGFRKIDRSHLVNLIKQFGI